MREDACMSFTFTAVRTTGIYCRPTCGGRPLERNTRPYPSAVAAEAAGFRPCLRCRPDRLPAVTGGADGVVERALSLIADGALDDNTEATLARRLGLTERHLRRLFNDQVGATPALVARSRRAHFARRLLDETDLRVADVALAAGFASVRQMNRVIYDVFRFTPAELRSKRRDADRLVADGGLPLRVAYTGAYDFTSMLAHRAPRAIPGVEHVDGTTYRRTVTSCGNPGVIEISDAGDGAHLLVVTHMPTLLVLIDDIERSRRMFGLDRPDAAATALASDDVVGPLVAVRPGLRVPGAWDPFETALRILLGQQVSVAAATTLAGRLARSLGTPVRGLEQMGLTHIFPAAGRIAESRLDRLRAIGLPAARAEALRAFARAYADERIHLDAAATMDDLVASLTSLPGVGPWTAHMIAAQAAGHADAFPAGDLGLRRGVAALLGSPRMPSERELLDMAEAWRPDRALAAMHLWASARSDVAAVA